MAKRVLIADDSEFMRNLLREILEGDFEIVGEAENGVEAVDLYKEHDPDITMMDIVMPIRSGSRRPTRSPATIRMRRSSCVPVSGRKRK